MYWTVVILTAILLSAYCVLILLYRQWFLHLALYKKDNELPQTHFSVIIPARDEEENIETCLRSILQQNYPASLLEVIVINDHSTDQTEKIIRQLQNEFDNLQLLNLVDHIDNNPLNAYKKKAIEIAISKSKGNWIITTDADCVVGKSWLQSYDSFIREKKSVFVAAPVIFTNNRSFLSIFQQLDFVSLQGITAAAVSAGHHAMCNGANIAYRKNVFEEVGAFKGIDTIASGDDMLLMYKIKQKYPEGLGYLFSKEAIVTTAPMPDWKNFFNQRIRWASKADKYKDKGIFWTLLLVYLVNAFLLILFFWSFFIQGGIYNWLLLILAKTLIELSFMIPVSRFYDKLEVLIWFPLMQPFHIFYTVIAGWLGKFGTYQWKGRSVK